MRISKMKKTTRILPLVFSVLWLLAFVTANTRARNNQNPTPSGPGEIKAQIRWKKDMGLIPIGPGKILASNSACSPFFIVAYEYNSTYSGGSRIIATSRSTSQQPTEQEGYYVCDYSMQVPRDKGMFVRAGMGDIDLLPQTLKGSQDRLMPRQPYYLTDPWIGGTNSRPPAGRERGFVQRPTASNRYLESVLWEMQYLKIDSDPNPPSTSEKGPSPILNRATQFAGPWQANFGGSYLTMIFQQTGDRVTGQLNANSADFGLIWDGKVVDNTLRFTVVRRVPTVATYVTIGVGELLMNADRKSFKGTVLGVATSGTFLGR
jgi:hypothetical protein